MKTSNWVLIAGIGLILMLSGCSHPRDSLPLNARAACAPVAEDGRLLPAKDTAVNSAVSGHPDKAAVIQFHDAVREGDLEAVRRLVAQDRRLLSECDPSNGVTGGMMPLWVAVDAGKLEIVKLLVALGSDVNCGYPVQRAAALTSGNGIRSLAILLPKVMAGRSTNELWPIRGETPPSGVASPIELNQILGEWKTIIASQKDGIENRLAILGWLLDNGGDPNAFNPYTKTPPLVAAMFYSSDGRAVKMLLEHGAKTEIRGGSDGSALHLAVVFDNAAAVRALAVGHADLEARTKGGVTALMLAAGSGQFEIVKILLEHGANFRTRNDSDQNALVYAVYHGQEETFNAMFAQGARREDFTGRRWSLLNLACLKGNVAIVDAVLSCDVDLETTDSHGYTPLLSATENGHLEIVKKLVARGANHKARMSKGGSALDLAASSGSLELVRLFVSLGLDVNDAVSGATPLCGAAMYGRLDIVRFLLEKGAKAEPGTRITPLMMVACGPKALNRRNTVVQMAFPGLPPGTEDEYIAVAEFLLANGANVNAKTPDGGTPVSLAKANGFQRMADLLASKGAVTTEIRAARSCCQQARSLSLGALYRR